MINAKELRIGNKIIMEQYKGHAYLDEDKPDVIQTIIDVDVNALMAIVNGASHFQPIPLTPEILEQCGFEFNEFFKSWEERAIGLDFDFDLNLNYDPIIFFEGQVTVQIGKTILYLHQLQNLYFALTGFELEVNL